MGLSILRSASYVSKVPVDPAMPDPHKYEIERHNMTGQFLSVQIRYPNCTNYEGRKILIYYGITIEKLIEQKYIDPHFSDNPKYKFPIARFEPTDNGWLMALLFTARMKGAIL